MAAGQPQRQCPAPGLHATLTPTPTPTLTPTLTLPHRSLKWLRDNSNVSVLHLDFTVTEEWLGETRVIELKPNGAQIAVTDENKVRLYNHPTLTLTPTPSRQLIAVTEEKKVLPKKQGLGGGRNSPLASL